jgi:predicted phosphodiesterase
MGNTDAWLLDPSPAPVEDESARRLMETETWSAQQLAESDREFLRTFRPTVEVALGDGTSLLCFHGSPRSNLDVIRGDTPRGDLLVMLDGWNAGVMAGGHTHEPMLRRLGSTTIINPGSVGLPFEAGAPTYPDGARYAIVTAEAGTLSVEFRRARIETEAVARAILGSGMPHAAYWAGQWQAR